MSDMMNTPTIPSEHNNFLVEHIKPLRASYRHWIGRELVPPRMTDSEAARYLFQAKIALLSHNTDPDPKLNYGNRTAMSLFGLSWQELIEFPSRLTAETPNREARAELLKQVTQHGFIDYYQGIRIGKHGRRFEILNAVIWNILDSRGHYLGQAATFKEWNWL